MHVLERLSRLNISKSEDPDLLHPRVVYEIQVLKLSMRYVSSDHTACKRNPSIQSIGRLSSLSSRTHQAHGGASLLLQPTDRQRLEAVIRRGIRSGLSSSQGRLRPRGAGGQAGNRGPGLPQGIFYPLRAPARMYTPSFEHIPHS